MVQVVSGVSGVVFWIGNFFVDFLLYAIACAGLIVVIVAFKVDVYSEADNLVLVIIILALNGWAMLPVDYLLHFVMNSPSTAVIVVVFIGDLLGTLRNKTDRQTDRQTDRD